MKTRWAIGVSAMAALCAAGLARPAAAGADTDARVLVLTLENAAAEGKPLRLHLDAAGPRVQAAFATGLNAVLHDADASGLRLGRAGLRPGEAGLRLDGATLAGPVKVTVNPDNYFPADGKAVACAFTLEARVEADKVSGTYEGTFGGEARRGAVAGEVSPRPDYGRSLGLKARFLGALHRLYAARGSNWKYALDMNLLARVESGRVVRPRFETIVPDYRRYSAIVEAADLAIEGNAFTGTFRARVDYGGQGGAKDLKDPVELHVYTVRGTVIGDTVGGTYDVRVGDDHEGRGLRFAGSLDSAPPPRPEQSLAFLRLHGAMKEGPVILNLSLADDGLINGLAWASGYNHQPHTVDASGLRLEGADVRGRVTVSIVPDCYKPPERFTLEYAIDARVTDDALAGTFTGTDRGRETSGTITGHLRAKRTAAPPVTMAALAACELELGYCLVRGRMPTQDWEKYPMNHANVRFACAGGKVTGVQVLNPHKADAFAAKVADHDLRLDGDRLTGSVAFDLTSEVVEGGRYAFTFEAIVDGDRLIGFWRGTHNGRDILTKSAKLGGTVRTAPSEEDSR